VTAEIGVAVFGADRPIVGDGIVEAATDCPARAGLRNTLLEEDRKAQPVIILDVGESGAASGVEENAVEGDTQAATDRPLNILAGLNREAWQGGHAAHENGFVQASAVDRAFEADN